MKWIYFAVKIYKIYIIPNIFAIFVIFILSFKGYTPPIILQCIRGLISSIWKSHYPLKKKYLAQVFGIIVK